MGSDHVMSINQFCPISRARLTSPFPVNTLPTLSFHPILYRAAWNCCCSIRRQEWPGFHHLVVFIDVTEKLQRLHVSAAYLDDMERVISITERWFYRCHRCCRSSITLMITTSSTVPLFRFQHWSLKLLKLSPGTIAPKLSVTELIVVLSIHFQHTNHTQLQ